ncbi:MAG: hypothetical protein HS111_14725 [Kofleriaceae bacterium]|nr:hypothetical protein [Kofleriaceae bacterium]
MVVRRAARSFLAAMAALLGMRGVALRGRQHTAFDPDAWIRLVAATGLPEPRAAELARAAMACSGGAADEIAPYLADEDPRCAAPSTSWRRGGCAGGGARAARGGADRGRPRGAGCRARRPRCARRARARSRRWPAATSTTWR